MSNRRWTIRLQLTGDDRGGAVLSFALVLPIVLALSLAFIDFSMLLFDYHRANEATRRGARVAALSDPIPDVSQLEIGEEIVCTRSGGQVDCGPAPVLEPAAFEAMLQQMQDILPQISEDNLTVTYVHIGLGSAARPGGILPLITIRLDNVTFEFRALAAVPGAPRQMTMPDFRTTQIAGGRAPT